MGVTVDGQGCLLIFSLPSLLSLHCSYIFLSRLRLKLIENQNSTQNLSKNPSKIAPKILTKPRKIGPKSVSEGSWLLSPIFHRFLSPPGASRRVLGASWTRLGRLLGAKLEPKRRPKASKN